MSDDFIDKLLAQLNEPVPAPGRRGRGRGAPRPQTPTHKHQWKATGERQRYSKILGLDNVRPQDDSWTRTYKCNLCGAVDYRIEDRPR